jgi:hypothetical protein
VISASLSISEPDRPTKKEGGIREENISANPLEEDEFE